MFKKTWPFVICQSQERPVEVANKYYELPELDFEIPCANEATWEDVVLIKQVEIISQLLGFLPPRQSSLNFLEDLTFFCTLCSVGAT